MSINRSLKSLAKLGYIHIKKFSAYNEISINPKTYYTYRSIMIELKTGYRYYDTNIELERYIKDKTEGMLKKLGKS